MKIVVIGGNGLIGAKLVARLRERGHDAVAASRSSGVDAVTGAGLADALAGAQVVVDVLNAPSFEAAAALAFFEASTANLLAAEVAAGVGHHVALSVVGAERLPDAGYMRAKVAQEGLIRSGGVPSTVLRATQFFEFVGAITAAGVDGDAVRLPPALMQPVAADDVADALADIAVAGPVNGVVEVAGPEAIRMDDLARRFLAATGDARAVTTDASAGYFGAAVDDRSLTPGDAVRVGPTRFADWLARR